MRHNKYKLLVKKADLIHATPQYAHIRFKNVHESAVSLGDVASVFDSESSNQSRHETIPPEPEEAIHEGCSPSENTSTHHEHIHWLLNCQMRKTNLCIENQMMTHQKLRMMRIPI